ncbi:MAG: hypothetical protein HQL55_20230, partial [Magnetococcales bacterium]|nr:hypothetical protein [Magnetococcales bacterium]
MYFDIGDYYLTITGAGFTTSLNGSITGLVMENWTETFRASGSISYSFNGYDVALDGAFTNISYSSADLSMAISGSFPVVDSYTSVFRTSRESITFNGPKGKRVTFTLTGNFTTTLYYLSATTTYTGTINSITIVDDQGGRYAISGSIPVINILMETTDFEVLLPIVFVGNDNLTGNTGSDSLLGYSGNDTINGAGNNDSLWGGAGNDSLQGGSGNDGLDPGEGNNSVDGGEGEDDLFLAGELANYVFSRPSGTTVRIAWAGSDKSEVHLVSNVEYVNGLQDGSPTRRALTVQDLLANTASAF